MADTSASRWALRSLRYWQQIAYPGVDPAEISADYAEAWRRMTAVCGLTASPATSPGEANILAVSAPIDGPYNVLALSELPGTDAWASVLHQTFDSAESELSKDQRIACMAHEIGHCLGLGHSPEGSGNLMDPILSSVGTPQAGDVAELQARYGPPAGEAATPAPVLFGDLSFTAPGLYVLAIADQAFEFTIAQAGDYPVFVGPKT